MCHSVNLPKDFFFFFYFTRNKVIFLMSKWWLIYKPAAMNSIWNLQVCNPPKGTPLPGTPCCFAVRLVKHTCLTVVRLEKRDHSQAGRLFRNHSDVFIETSSILKTHVVERIRQKRKIVAFVVPVVPKRIVLRYQELPAGCVTVLKSLRIESAFAALPAIT